jgi:hypothetical protein
MNPRNLHDLDAICGRKLGELDHMTRGRAQLPSIIVETRINPCGRRYTMMDGMHRICRLKRAGATRGCFYVLSEDQAYEATTKLDPAEARKRTGWRAPARDSASARVWGAGFDARVAPATRVEGSAFRLETASTRVESAAFDSRLSRNLFPPRSAHPRSKRPLLRYEAMDLV